MTGRDVAKFLIPQVLVAAALGTTPRTMARWVVAGVGPTPGPRSESGRVTGYTLRAVVLWAEQRAKAAAYEDIAREATTCASEERSYPCPRK